MNKKLHIDALSDENLLDTRFCELTIAIQGSLVEEWINEFYEELNAHSLKFKPFVYLADEWLCPEGVPCIGIPFYLAHPRLRSLEKKIMLDVEGGEHDEFMRLMRHEMGHAVMYAFRLQRKKKWRDLFGHPSKEESDHYRFKKYSRNFVHNVENFYAQSHPDEDFAETFAVWLNPSSGWRQRYKNFPVLRKLEYIDSLMNKLKDKTSEVPLSTRYYNVKYIKKRLRTHYKEKKKLYASDSPDYYDKELSKVFIAPPEGKIVHKDMLAYTFLRQNKRMIINTVSKWSKERKYVVDHLVTIFMKRVKEKGLACRGAGLDTMPHIIACVTAMIKNYQMTAQFKEGE